MKTVWITRTLPGAAATAARVEALGHAPLVAPLLDVVPLAPPALDFAGVVALAFTSANGVRALAGLSTRRDFPVFVVGSATAASARAAGFADIRSAQGGVADLARLLTATRPTGAILHPGALEPAGDLVGDLTAAGLSARALAVYDTVPLAVPTEVLDRLASIHAVLVHSPKAARRLAETLTANPAPDLDILCLSPQVRNALAAETDRRVLTAARPSEDALLSLL